jgi:phosphate transport system substrate-binding protein
MYRQHQLLRVGIALCALSGLFFMFGCSNTTEGSATTGSAPKAVLGAAGSTFIAPLMGKWVSTYQQTHPKVLINYRPIGSGGGIEEMKQGYLSFGATDAPLNDEQVKEMSSVIQVPATAGPVCIVYNLPNLSAPLRLSAKSLSDIYLGNIISWQDPAIARDNPGVTLPRAAVIAVHRSDGSGTTNIFTSYLTSVSHEWSRMAGHGLSVTWPIGLGAEGSTGVLAIVKQTRGTIGYMELNYAKESGIPVASIQNRAGHFVEPSPVSAAAAITAFGDALAKDVRAPIVDPPASAPDAYPISGLSFILIHKDRQDADQQEAVKGFIAFAISTGQNSVEELSYAKLPDSVQKQGEQLLSQLTANGQPLK